MKAILRKRISIILGTRPEAIKLAPIILNLKEISEFDCHVCVTAQHREMLDQVLSIFGIVPDVDLNLMSQNQTLSTFTARAMQALDQYMLQYKPDMILVQGDTTTVLCAALTAFYHRIPIGHVEAGLRTWNMNAPWPEEANRVLTSRLATIHFSPTENSRQNLLKEGALTQSVYVTGNTVIDSLFIVLDEVTRNPPQLSELPDFLQPNSEVNQPRLILITGHRRENFGEGIENICNAIILLAQRFPNVHFVYPVHLNPNVSGPVERILGASREQESNVHLIKPLTYLSFVALMNRSYLIVTDSGGIQEEAPSLGKPVLVTRENTERPEAIQFGTAKLVGTNTAQIVEEISRLLLDQSAYDAMSKAQNPYGDGKATSRIIDICTQHLHFLK